MSTVKVPAKSRGRVENLTGGSRKGKPNKATTELKQMILGALEDAGGQQYLADRAKDPRTAAAFLSLVGKALPLTIKGTGENGAIVFEKIVREIVRPK